MVRFKMDGYLNDITASIILKIEESDSKDYLKSSQFNFEIPRYDLKNHIWEKYLKDIDMMFSDDDITIAFSNTCKHLCGIAEYEDRPRPNTYFNVWN